MQVAFHLGAHCTDEDRLLKSLLANKNALAAEGISVPGPGRYRQMLQDSARTLKGAPADTETQEKFRDEILHDRGARRVVLCDENFMCVHARIFENGMLYEKSSYKTQWLRNLFPEDEVEFHIGIRNPASFIPAAFHHPDQRYESFRDFMSGTDIMDLRWSDVILTIRENNPGCPLTVWCNEDTPLLWSQLLRELSGHDPQTRLNDDFGILNTIMKPIGLRRMNKYLEEHPPETEPQRVRIIAAFLEKFGITDEIEEELDAPGWTEELVNEMTEIYEEDLFEIERMSGVTFLLP
jgi:hypothetical protein